MTETAQPFDNSTGDASGVAPYSAEQLSKFLYYIGDFVIPGDMPTASSPLEISNYVPAVNGNIRVLEGMALVRGALYVNTDNNLNIAIDAAANNRIDYIVLRFSSVNHTVRVTVIKGAEAANPNFPNLTANDFALAWVWVPAGFNPAADPVSDQNIHDVRSFWDTGESAYLYSNYNLLHNSEFIAYSQLAAGNVAPEGWKRTAVAPTSVTGVASVTTQPRGRSIRIQSGGGNRGIETWLRVTNGWYTLRGTLNITAGQAGILFESTGTGGSTLDNFYKTGSNIEFILRRHVQTGEELHIELRGLTAGDDFTVGQLVVSQGFVSGYYHHKHELIMLDTALTDAAWTATAKSTGETLIDLKASFGPMLTADTPIRGVILRLRANDSGSAAAACGMYTAHTPAVPLSYLKLGRLPNDVIRDVIAFAPMIGGLGTTFYLGVTATGVGTLDATAEIIGIVT